jgi:tripartite-type tricarboxylate transporter receptor subunit TctC
VRLIVCFAAGGPSDIAARLGGPWLSERLGQPFIIENRPGAGGNLGTETVVRAPADGYTLLEATSTNAWNTTLYRSLTFDFIHDLVPIAGVCRYAGVIVVNLPFRSQAFPSSSPTPKPIREGSTWDRVALGRRRICMESCFSE